MFYIFGGVIGIGCLEMFCGYFCCDSGDLDKKGKYNGFIYYMNEFLLFFE